jgi:hypothetical protein
MDGARKLPQLNVRIPAVLKDMLTRSAADSYRTLSGEVVDRLMESYEREKEAKSDAAQG